MQVGYELVKEQLFFRKEMIERVRWFIQLRWVAVGGALAASWIAHVLLKMKFPYLAVCTVLLVVAGYNVLFLFIYRRLKSKVSPDVNPFNIFAHFQMSLDLLALFVMIYFTGGIKSPLLMFTIFHIILAGILLSPTSCFIYSALSLAAAGLLVYTRHIASQPLSPVVSENILSLSHLDSSHPLLAFLAFTAVILITAFLVTTIKLSLRTKGRQLLCFSKELDLSNAKLTALYDMVKQMGLESDLQKLMDSATRNAAAIMGVKGCSIKLLDDQRRTLKFASTFGLSQDYTSRGSIDIEKSSINRKIIEGSVYAIGNIEVKDYFQYPENISREGIRSMICLPLKIEKMILGVFCVYSDVLDDFSPSDICFFERMAELTALAMKNLKSELNKVWFFQKSAHQLRSPLNAIYSMLDVVTNGYLGAVDPKQEKILLKCKKRIKILGLLISDLLKLGIRRTDSHPLTLRPLDSKEVLKPLVQFYQTQALEKKIDIVFRIDDSLPKILADEELLDTLFTNIISNAVKYTPAGGQVLVSLSGKKRERVLFEVSDTGIGISEKEIPNLFSEFFRTESAKKTTDEGTGLGLVIVKEILDRLSGTISLKSKAGEGTCVTCSLPAVQ